jgi:uncharacterized protein
MADAPVPPRPTKYLTDNAGVFEAERGRVVNEKLAAHERATSNQILVDVEKRLPPATTIEDFAHAAFRQWGVGQKGKNNGVLLLVFVDDRKMRIEVGYGLEGAIPDAAAHRITDEIIKPWFRKDDYAHGIEAGVDALLAAASGEGNRGTGRTAAERDDGWTSRVLASLPNDPGKLLIVLFFALLLPVLAILLIFGGRRSRRTGSSWRAGGSWGGSAGMFGSSGDSSSSSSTSSSDSSSSSSDFSGGGGDSGGGGASDSW